MSSWLEEKYVALLSPALRNFKVKKPGQLWNFSCPLCGDSKSDKKLRGYIYKKKNILKFHCHNCAVNIRFITLLKHINQNLYFEYRKEYLKENKEVRAVKTEEKPAVQENAGVFNALKKISDLAADHPARLYLINRKIPEEKFSDLYYAPYFKKWVNTLIPDKFDLDQDDEPRLIIPFRDEIGVTGFTGRSFDPNTNLRYITISLCDRPKVYNANNVNYKKPYYVVEGPFDSMFLPNSVAVGGSALRQVVGQNGTAIFDNQPRNREIVKLMKAVIDDGTKVVIWPDGLEGKDINEYIKSGLSVEEVVGIISKNTYDGLIARVRFNEWKKI